MRFDESRFLINTRTGEMTYWEENTAMNPVFEECHESGRIIVSFDGYRWNQVFKNIESRARDAAHEIRQMARDFRKALWKEENDALVSDLKKKKDEIKIVRSEYLIKAKGIAVNIRDGIHGDGVTITDLIRHCPMPPGVDRRTAVAAFTKKYWVRGPLIGGERVYIYRGRG